MPDGFTGYVWTETVPAKKKKLRIKKYPDTWVWRHIGDIIDSHISWPWKHFFTSKVVSSSYLVIVNYVRNVGSMSSSLRVLRSCDGIVFFGAPLALQPCSQSLSTVATRLRRFHVFVSSVFPFVDFATYLV